MPVYALDDHVPEISGDGTWIAPDASVIGKVRLGGGGRRLVRRGPAR